MARPRCPCGDRSSSMRNTTTKRRSGSASRTCSNTSNPFSETSGSHMTNERCPRGTPEEALSRSEEHTSELQSRGHLVCRLLLEKKKKHPYNHDSITGDNMYPCICSQYTNC